MMSNDWLSQSVKVSKNWLAYSRFVDNPELRINLNRQLLDDKIINADKLKDDRTTTVVRLTVEGTDTVLKRYNARSVAHKFKRALRRSCADRCWKMSHTFARAGLNVAMPLFMYEERFGFICKNTYFANEYLPGDELLEVLPNMAEAEIERVVTALKEAMTRMQSNKLTHGDMKATNLLWVAGELYFVDLDAARQHLFSTSWKRANLKDRKRFLKNWQNVPELKIAFAWMKE